MLQIKRVILASLAICALLSVPVPPADARFRMMNGAEITEYADFIAVVDVATPTQTVTKVSENSQYQQRADAKVARVLKGGKIGSIVILGDVTGANGSKLCVPDITLAAGKHLVFLKTSPYGYVTAGGGMTFSAIKDNKLNWYKEANGPAISQRSLDSVLAEVEKLIHEKPIH